MKHVDENPWSGNAGLICKTETKEIAEYLAGQFADIHAIWYVEADLQSGQHPNTGIGFAIMTSFETREDPCDRERLTADIQTRCEEPLRIEVLGEHLSPERTLGVLKGRNLLFARDTLVAQCFAEVQRGIARDEIIRRELRQPR